MKCTTFLWLVTAFVAAATQPPCLVTPKTGLGVAVPVETPGTAVAPNPRKLLDRYRQAAPNWDKSTLKISCGRSKRNSAAFYKGARRA